MLLCDRLLWVRPIGATCTCTCSVVLVGVQYTQKRSYLPSLVLISVVWLSVWLM